MIFIFMVSVESVRELRRHVPRWVLAALVVSIGIFSACEFTPHSSREVFDAQIVPVLEQHCSSTQCHGVGVVETANETIDWEQLFYYVDDEGRIIDSGQAYVAAKRTINTQERPGFSTLLRKPLSAHAGGLPHFGESTFTWLGDPAYQAIYDWIELEHGGGEDPMPLSDLETKFRDEVQPVLEEGTCMTSFCHGATAGGTPYKLDAGYLGEFSNDATRTNYEASRRMISLGGFPFESRLLAKSQPLSTHGTAHKGANFDFYSGSPAGVGAITRWICAETEFVSAARCGDTTGKSVSALVYLRGKVEPRHSFDLDAFVPGRELVYASVSGQGNTGAINLGEEVELNRALGVGEVDIRDLAVSPNGQLLAFAMRTSVDEGHHIYELDLTTLDFRQRTFGNRQLAGGAMATDRDPTWASNDEIWFVSTRDGLAADRPGMTDAEIYSLSDADELNRWTHTPHIERKPVFFSIGEEAGGEVGFSSLRETIVGESRAHIFRFPPDLSTEYHQHFGVNAEQTRFFDMRELPDGRYISVVGEVDDNWRGGQLGVVDRNFGPPIVGSDVSSLPFGYLEPLVMLDDGLYRDPAPLPDGSILVASSITKSAQPHYRLERLVLEENPDMSGPVVIDRQVLAESSSLSIFDAEVVLAKAEPRVQLPTSEALRERGNNSLGRFHHQGMGMIDSLLQRLEPTGKRTPLLDIAGVRIIEAIRDHPDERANAPNGLGGHHPNRILAELPVAGDGSFQVRIPSGTAFRIQALDSQGMAIGVTHNRWFDLAGGQTLVQGLSSAQGLERYDTQCAACHGSADGRGLEPANLEPVDAITGASLTLSRFEQQNPRQPIEAPILGMDTRIEIDFVADIQPIFAEKCSGGRCHTGDTPAANLNLSSHPTQRYSIAYESLLAQGEGSLGGRKYVAADEGRARSSSLMEVITGEELDAPWGLGEQGALSPHSSADGANMLLSAEQIRLLVRWIDTGANFRN